MGEWETHFWILDMFQETSFVAQGETESEVYKFRIVSGPRINHFEWMHSFRIFWDSYLRRDMSNIYT